MVWFTRRSASFKDAENQRRHFRQSIELPIAISVEGLPADVFATLVNISETGCRFRSLILLERNRNVEFELRRSAGAALTLRGRIITRRFPPQGGGYEYGVDFIVAMPADRERLTKEIAEMQRREGAARAHSRGVPSQIDVAGAQRRTALRATVSFPIRYRFEGRATATGEASDISMGGLRLASAQPLPIGSVLELRFTLPDHVLSVYPPPSERVEISPFGPRKVRIPDNRRPFEEMSVRGRVVSHFGRTKIGELYGVQFTDIDGYQREEIARFAHAAQLSKLRTS